MNKALIFLPVLAHIALPMLLFGILTLARLKAAKSGQVDLKRTALHADAWPDYVVKISNNLRNQFEAPVLFYALTLQLWALDAVSATGLTLAWIFVASRYVHTYVHITSNHVPSRALTFTVGVLCLIPMVLTCLTAIIG